MEWFFILLTIFLAGFRYTSMPIALIFSLVALSLNKFIVFLMGLIVSAFVWYNLYDFLWFMTLDMLIPAYVLFISGVMAFIIQIIQLNTLEFEELTKVVMSSEIACIFLFGLIRWLGIF